MTVQQLTGAPFDENAQTVIRTDEDYTMNNSDDIVDVFGPGVTVSFPPQPLVGQRFRVLAATNLVSVNGNGHPIAGGLTLVPATVGADFTFSSTLVWIGNCCAEGQG